MWFSRALAGRITRPMSGCRLLLPSRGFTFTVCREPGKIYQICSIIFFILRTSCHGCLFASQDQPLHPSSTGLLSWHSAIGENSMNISLVQWVRDDCMETWYCLLLFSWYIYTLGTTQISEMHLWNEQVETLLLDIYQNVFFTSLDIVWEGLAFITAGITCGVAGMVWTGDRSIFILHFRVFTHLLYNVDLYYQIGWRTWLRCHQINYLILTIKKFYIGIPLMGYQALMVYNSKSLFIHGEPDRREVAEIYANPINSDSESKTGFKINLC